MSSSGVVTFERVADEVEEAVRTRVPPDFVREVVGVEEGFKILDDSAGWFWLPTGRNRLTNTLRKIFAITDRAHVSEVRLAIQRVRRLNGFAPPQRVLLEFASIIPDFRREGSFIERSSEANTQDWIEGADLVFAEVLRERGGLLDRITLEKECRRRGMNENTFGIWLHGSPVMLKLGRGVFGLVGTAVTAAEIAEHELAKSSIKPIAEFGWTTEGEIRIEYRITENMLYTGFIPLPSQISEYLSGQFALIDEEGEPLGFIRTKRHIAWNLKKLFRRLGGDLGDPFALNFDLANMRAKISFGRAN